MANGTVMASANDFASGVEYFLPSEAWLDCHRMAHRHCGRACVNLEANGRMTGLIWHTKLAEPLCNWQQVQALMTSTLRRGLSQSGTLPVGSNNVQLK